jgi:hypothetical protein
MKREGLTFINSAPFLKLADRPEIKGYLAGFLDADGSMGIYHCKDSKGHFVLRVSFWTSHKDVIKLFEQCKQEFGGYLRRWKGKSRNPNRHTLIAWCLDCRKALNILKLLEPHLIHKKKQAQLAIQFYQLIDSVPKNSHKHRGLLKQKEDFKIQMHKLKEVDLLD